MAKKNPVAKKNSLAKNGSVVKKRPVVKSQLHPRNKHRQRYDFTALIQTCPALKAFVARNAYQDLSIDFFNPQAVRCLNQALLKHFYHIEDWQIPQHNLCPPIPGRVDYVHYLADLLALSNGGKIPRGTHVHCLDVGVGANCVYPLVGCTEYGWSFVGSDIETASLKSAQIILDANPHLGSQIVLRLQRQPTAIFESIIQHNERFALTLCNPPFHRSAAEARQGSQRKQTNLKARGKHQHSLNFGGQSNELWCEGGELKFIQNMITESRRFADQCLWFTSLVSKEANLKGIYQTLQAYKPTQVKTIKMGQGNKISRFVAWSFIPTAQQGKWLSHP